MMRFSLSALLAALALSATAGRGAILVDDFSYRDAAAWPKVVSTRLTGFRAGTDEMNPGILGGVRNSYVYGPVLVTPAVDYVAGEINSGSVVVTTSGDASPSLRLGWGNMAADAMPLGIPSSHAAFVAVVVDSFDGGPGDWPLHVVPTVATGGVRYPLPTVIISESQGAAGTEVDIPLAGYWAAYPDRVTLDGISLTFSTATGGSLRIAQVTVVPEPAMVCVTVLGMIAIGRRRGKYSGWG